MRAFFISEAIVRFGDRGLSGTYAIVNEWIWRSFIRWGATVGVEELKRLAAEGIATLVHQGGRMLIATTHGGKQSTWTLPANLTFADLNAMLEKTIWFLENHDDEEVDAYLRNCPSSTAHGRFGMWWP